MEQKKDFKKITKQIKDEILSLGYGHIKFDKDAEDLWIDDYENYLSASIHVNGIKIDFDVITLCKDEQDILTFNHVYSIDRQIQIYETIYEHKDQLSYYELDWSNSFKAIRIEGDEGKYVWRILSSDEARHIWYNGKGELCRLFDDDTEVMIDNENSLKECIKNGHPLIISVY